MLESFKHINREIKVRREAFIQLLSNDLRQNYISTKHERKRKPLTEHTLEIRRSQRRKYEVKYE